MRASLLELPRSGTKCVLKGEPVGVVDIAVDPDQALFGGDIELDPHVTVVDRVRFIVEVKPGFGILDEAVELGGPYLVGEVGDVVVDPGGCVLTEDAGGIGDTTGFPGLEVAGFDAGPGAGEPVGEFDGVTDVGLAGLGGAVDREGELGEGELRDEWCSGSWAWAAACFWVRTASSRSAGSAGISRCCIMSSTLSDGTDS